MARRRYPVPVFVSILVTLAWPVIQCSQVNQVYAFPPASMLHGHQQEQQQNGSAAAETIQTAHVMKPPEIILRNNLIHQNSNSNASHYTNAVAQKKSFPSTMATLRRNASTFQPTSVTPQNGLTSHFSSGGSPTPPFQIPSNVHFPRPSVFSPRAGNFSPPFPNFNFNNNNAPFFPTAGPVARSTTNGTVASPNLIPLTPVYNAFNEVDRFVSFVPLDYENGQMPGFMPPHHKREAPPANRRSGQGPPPPPASRRNSTSTLKNIISSFHEKVSRIFLGPRRRGPKPMRQFPQPQPQPEQKNDLRFDPTVIKEQGRSLNGANQAPASERSFTAALNTVAQILQQNQYIPMLGKRERVRTLSQEESQLLDGVRRRDRRVNRRRQNRRRHPRKRRPHHPRDRPPYDDDYPPNHHYEPYHDDDEDEYRHKKPKSHRYPNHFEDDTPPHKDHGPPYKGFKSFKSFKPWRPSFIDSHEDHDEQYRGDGHHKETYEGSERPATKPAWFPDSREAERFGPSKRYQSNHNHRLHRPAKYRDYSPEKYYGEIADTEGFKPIKPFYGGYRRPNVPEWDENKMKFHKVIEYDHGMIGASPYRSKLKHGASHPVKDEDARIPKIVINHHHNLPPPISAASSFGSGAFPANTVLSYRPPVYFQDDFFSGNGRSGRKKEYRPNDYPPDSFVVNDYGKPPIPGFDMPPVGFGAPPQIQHSPGPPPGVAASSPMGGHMVFDHFAQNMPTHFMNGKLPTPNMNHVNHFGPPAGAPVSFSSSNTHFPKPMLQGGHFPSHSPGFPVFRQHHHGGPMDGPFGKPSQMSSYNDNVNENFPHFPQSTPPAHHFEGGPGPNPEYSPPPGPPPPDSSPFPSTNEHHDGSRGFLPPFNPVSPKEDFPPPTQGPIISPESREQFFKPPRKKGRKFELKIVKTLSSGFEIPDKLTNHPLAEPEPTPIMNYFDLGVPDREHYKKKQRQNHNINDNINNFSNSHETYSPHNTRERTRESRRDSPPPPIINDNKFDSNEFNYSTLPENWRNFRPDPSHKKLPSLTHDNTESTSRMHKFRSALHPKSLMKAIMSRFPRAKISEKSSRAHTKFTPFDAVSKSREDMSGGGAPNRKRRKSTKTPASIQDIINSDSNNKEIVVPPTDDDDEMNNNEGDHHEEGESSLAPVIVLGKGRANKPSSKSSEKKSKSNSNNSNEMQTKMPFSSNDVLLGMHTIDVPLQAEIRMGEAEDKKKK